MRSRALVASVLFVAMAAAQARAQPSGAEEPTPSSDPKSPAVALAWSAGLTGVGSAILVGGLATDSAGAGLVFGTPILFIGPATGRWYAGGSTFPGLLIRGVTGAVALATIRNESLQCTDECEPGEDAHDLEGEAKVIVYGAAAIFFASAVYDVVRAPLDARAHDREHAAVTVAPAMMPGGQGSDLVPGLAVSGRF